MNSVLFNPVTIEDVVLSIEFRGRKLNTQSETKQLLASVPVCSM